MRLDALDGASRLFSERVFERFPQWRALTSVDAASGGFRVKVSSPTGDPKRTLRLYMERGVPLLEFGEWHTHADLWLSEEAFLSY